MSQKIRSRRPCRPITDCAEFMLRYVNRNDVILSDEYLLENILKYLFSSFNDEGRKLQAASFLIGSVIKQYENSNFIFINFKWVLNCSSML